MPELEDVMRGKMEAEIAIRRQEHAQQDAQMLEERRRFFQNQQQGSAFPQYGMGGRGVGYGGGYPAAQRLMFEHQLRTQRMLQQQQIDQQNEEQKQQLTQQDRERKLAVIDQEIEALKNNAMLDKNSPWYKDQMRLLQAKRTEALTDLNVYVPQEHEVDSGFTRTVIDPATGAEREEPIMSAYFRKEDGTLQWTREGKDIHAANLAKDTLAEKQANNIRTQTLNQEKQDLAEDVEKRMNRETAVNEKNSETTRAKERREASGETAVSEKEKEMMTHRKAAHAELESERKDTAEAEARDEYEAGKPTGARASLSWTNWKDLPEVEKQRRIEGKYTAPTHGEKEERADKLYNRLRPPTPANIDEAALYEQPEDELYPEEDPEEQFAGMEPAGLYDPTGQPLPMEGGMYSGFA